MKLYFLRHGIAEDPQPGQSDFSRRLTPEGIEETRRAARGMRRLGFQVDYLLSSPVVRARETADLVAEAFPTGPQVRETAVLACGCRLSELEPVLRDLSPSARVLLVGHEPDFSEMIGQLVGGGLVRMKKASLAYVETAALQAGGGELRWLLTARHLGAVVGPDRTPSSSP